MNVSKKDKKRISKILRGMRYRCKNSNYHGYEWYGGKGVKVCDEWDKNTQAFIDWSMNNGYDESKTIDRIDYDGNYEPSNCRWVDYQTQQNNRSNNVYLIYNGEKKTFREWAETLDIDYETIKNRYYKGWDNKEILTTPYNNHRRVLTIGDKTMTLNEWAEELNVEPGTLWYRYKNNFSDEDMVKPVNKNKKNIKSSIYITYNNEKKTIKEWAEELDLNVGTLYNRYYKGWTPEEILFGKKNSFKTIYLEYNNQVKTLREWSKIVGFHPDTLRNRYNKGWTPEEILFGKNRR